MSLTSHVGKIRHFLKRGWHVSASDRADVPAQQGNRLIPVSGGLDSACRVHSERLSSCLSRDSKLHLDFI